MQRASNNQVQPQTLFTTEQIIGSFGDKIPVLASGDYVLDDQARKAGFVPLPRNSAIGRFLERRIPSVDQLIGSKQSKPEQIYSKDNKEEPKRGEAPVLETMNLFAQTPDDKQIKIDYNETKVNSDEPLGLSSQQTSSPTMIRIYDTSDLEHAARAYSFNPTYFRGGLERNLGANSRPIFSRGNFGKMPQYYYGESRKYH